MYRILLCLCCLLGAPRGSEPLRVAAAADTQRALTELAAAFEKRTGTHVEFSFGSTGLLARQVEQGAPFDLFVAADEKYVADLERKGKVRAGSHRLYALGRLAIWTAPGGQAAASLADLAGDRFRRIAIANPEHAPYGSAAEQAMRKAGVWERLKPKLVYGENVQAALRYAQTGAADAAVISDSLVIGRGGAATLVPRHLYSPLRQALGIPASSTQPDAARRFADFLLGGAGRTTLRRYGFELPGEERKSAAARGR